MSSKILGKQEPSVLAERLLEVAGWGRISPVVVQYLAEGGVRDGLAQEDIKHLAEIGSSGAFPGNCRRDLFRGVENSLSIPKPVNVTLPYVELVHGKRTLKYTEYPIIMPTTFFMTWKTNTLNI